MSVFWDGGVAYPFASEFRFRGLRVQGLGASGWGLRFMGLAPVPKTKPQLGERKGGLQPLRYVCTSTGAVWDYATFSAVSFHVHVFCGSEQAP